MSLGLVISELLAAYQAGSLTPADVIRDIYDRISASGDDGVWIAVVPLAKALARAQQLTREGMKDKPLFGIPFAVKDNIDVAGMPTTAACPAFAYEPSKSATCVERIIAAGGILIGKTNLDQFATGLVGVRSPYGVARNPFNAAYIPGGSSSGSAVAVASGFVSFAYGTDTAGSGRVPAGFNNIVGLKPSIGLISAAGVVPACKSLDCVSVFALTVADAMSVLEVAHSADEADAYSRSAPKGYAAVVADTAAKFRFAVPEKLEFFGDDLAASAFAEARRRMEAMGGTAVEIDYTPFAEAQAMLYSPAGAAERTAALADFMDRHPDDIHPVTMSILRNGASAPAVDVHRMLHRLRQLRSACERLMADTDFLLVPTSGTIYTTSALAAEPLKLNANLGYYTNFVNYFDLSAIAVPNVMRDDGLPSGITLIAPAFHEPILAGFAARFHAATGLPLGATASSLPAIKAITAIAPRMDIALFGAHLEGQPLNRDLVARGGRFVRHCRTAPEYKAYALNGPIRRPGLVRVASGGTSFEGEIWSLPSSAVGAFLATIAPPLGLGSVKIDDGRQCYGFTCEGIGAEGAEDISHHSSWRAYLRSQG